MSSRQRQIVALRYGADLTVDEVAQRLHVAPGTVKATLHRARKALADQLTSRDEGAET
ncbi:MAG: sigma-70 region 4 domain-containing protein [Actinobacteria bacterium]|nr:sigma-70 region 4 domain-containing protein [Actinomycetota bacterium]